jgi:trans-aconitate methyltransferase
VTSIGRREPFVIRATQTIPGLRHAVNRLRQRSAVNIARKNTLDSTNRIYGSDWLLGVVLSPERLAFYDELARIFASRAPRSVIDVGCGTGHLLRFTVDRMSVVPRRVVGVDHSEAGILRARELLPSATWIVADLYDMPISEQFDLVTCTEVLEHLHEPGRAVGELRGLCAPGGRVAITVPDGAEDTWEGHVSFWDESALRKFLAPMGLTTIDRVEDGRVLLAWLMPEL